MFVVLDCIILLEQVDQMLHFHIKQVYKDIGMSKMNKMSISFSNLMGKNGTITGAGAQVESLQYI